MHDANAAPLPEPQTPGMEQYTLYSRVEITGLMRQIAERGLMVTLYFGANGGFILSTLLAVNPEFEELVFERGANTRDTDELLRSNRIVAVTFLDHVKIQFAAARAEATAYDGYPAFRVRMPDSLVRLQRRDSFRVPLPIARPIKLQTQRADGTPFELRMVDVSCGGIGATVGPGAGKLELGEVLHDCHLNLGDAGALVCSLEVRFVSLKLAASDATKVRYGLRFIDLPGPALTSIQRFINKLQRERHAGPAR